MKKILLLFIFFFISILKISAIDVPENIYYVDNGIYAYLENNNIILDDDQKLYIEYRLTLNDEVKTLDLIEVSDNQNSILLTDEIEDFLIDSRFVILDTEYIYSDWSKMDSAIKFDFLDKPTPNIRNLKYENGFTYDISNKEEIDHYFEIYKKIYNLEISYIEEYKIDDKWIKGLPDDIENMELKVHYEIGLIRSEDSNILKYENQSCMFGSTFCCNQILNISICVWLFIVSFVIISLLIVIDKRSIKKKEA